MRQRKKKSFYEELAEDDPISNARNKFQVETFNFLLDIFITHIGERFVNFRSVAVNFSVLDPRHFKDDSFEVKVNNLINIYKEDISDDTMDELRCFREVYGNIFTTSDLKIGQVLNFMVANDMCDIYPNLTVLYKLYLTIPVSSAATKRSFSRLKLIKSYLRTTMKQDRLSGLALLSIERQLAKELDYDKVIDTFSNVKTRRKAL